MDLESESQRATLGFTASPRGVMTGEYRVGEEIETFPSGGVKTLRRESCSFAGGEIK